MSFLRRLAAGVIEGRPRTHPFVESSYSFADPRAEDPATVAPEASGVRVMRGDAPAALVDDAVAHPPAPEVGRRPRPARGQRVEEPSTASAAERLPFRPLLPPPPMAQPLIEGGREESVPRPLLRATDPARAVHAGGSEVTPPTVAKGGSRAASPETDEPRRPLEPHTDRMRAGQAQVRVAAREATRPTRPAPRADAIQIHIGRIEVLAVPQPAPRPAAAPARTGLSLDDYLRRKGTNGGGG